MANIFSFSLPENGHPECQLRTFLSFLISREEGTTPHFAFASAEGSLIPNLTLREKYLPRLHTFFLCRLQRGTIAKFNQKNRQ